MPDQFSRSKNVKVVVHALQARIWYGDGRIDLKKRKTTMCGIFGVIGSNNAASLTIAGLHTLQHRAHDYAGIVTVNTDQKFVRRRGAGLITKVVRPQDLAKLQGTQALGHVRYPTVADDDHDDEVVNIQPLKGPFGEGQIAIAHNGNLTQLDSLHEFVSPARLSTSLDTEFILRLLGASDCTNIVDALKNALTKLSGSFALGLLTEKYLIAARDPAGNRPLSIGKLPGGGYCITSETCALPNVGATFEMDVAPGTIVIIDAAGYEMILFAESKTLRKCRFEAVYQGSPASRIFGEDVDEQRIQIGRLLAAEAPVADADFVVPVPDSSNFTAIGFDQENPSGTFRPVILRNHYVGRTFIEPTQELRDTGVARKFLFTAEAIKGARIVLVDDSIVRGTTIMKIVGRLNALGAREVHVRIGFPPIRHPCRYGVDIRTEGELIINRMSVEELQTHIGADSLAFLSEAVLYSLSEHPQDFCYACITGDYWD